MNAYLINPHARMIMTIAIANPDGLQEIYDHLRCQYFCAHNLEHGDVILLDDEGLLRPRQAYFSVDGNTPLAGFGLVVGCGKNGETTEPRITLEALQQSVRWLTKEAAQQMHYRTRAAAAKAAREIMCDNRHAYVYVVPAIDFPEDQEG